MMERLQKVLAAAGIASRRQAEILIQSGKVKVNGQVVTELGTKVDALNDKIEVRGKVVSAEQKRTFLFYKPMYVITSMQDPQGRKVVTDFFGEIPERVYPVGRLDFDTEGLLLMTNDGALANQLLHPRYEMKKTYVATVKGVPTPDVIEQLRLGVLLEDGITAPAEVKLLRTEGQISKVQLTIHEGRNRQVRRMCKAVGLSVMHLVRTRVGNLSARGIKKGEYRELTAGEIVGLKKLLSGERTARKRK